MPRCPLVERFRDAWLAGALPLVVERSPQGDERVCSAPNLWMGARWRARQLRAAEARPGMRVAYVGPPGAELVQWMVGAWRAGVSLVPAAGADAARPLRPHLVVGAGASLDDPLALREAPLDAPGIRLRFLEGHPREVDDAGLLAAVDGTPKRGRGRPVLLRGPWTRAEVLLGRVLPALADGAELWVEVEPPSGEGASAAL
jgi:hypothetical protein